MSGGGRVYRQGCVSAVPRWAVRLGRGAIRNCGAQVAHFAGLRIEADCSTGVALVLQLCVAASGAGPIWHVYPMGARRVARWIFVECGAAGRGILKDRRISRAGPFAGHPERSRGISLRSRLDDGAARDQKKNRRPEASGTKREMTKSIHVGGRPVWAEISLKAILRNLEIIRKHVNGGAQGDQSKKSRQDAGATRDERQNRRPRENHRDANSAPEASGTKTRRMILAVVKSNAYGLGAVPISKALQKAGTEWFGVTCANEGIELREAGIRKRILILTGFWPGEEKRLIKNNLTPAVFRVGDLRHLERSAQAVGGKGRVL